MNSEQIKGIAERYITAAIVSWLTAMIVAGKVPFLSANDATVVGAAIATLLVTASLGALGWMQNRVSSFAQAMVKVEPKTVVLTDPKVAAATPEANIISIGSSPTTVANAVEAAKEEAQNK